MNESIWICTKLKIASLDQISSIINFPILWNLFENKYFCCDFRPIKIGTMFIENREIILSIDKFTHKVLDVFRKRYYQDTHFTSNFYSLNLRENDDPETVKKVLQGESCEPEIIFKGIIIIISRFRNNYFHGLKEPDEIITQNIVFSYINEYLIRIIDA